MSVFYSLLGHSFAFLLFKRIIACDCLLLITAANIFYPDQARQNVGPV